MSRGPKCTSLFQRLVRPWTESRAASEAVAERAGFASLAGCSGSSAPLSRVQDAVRIFNSGGISRPVISDLLSRRFWGEAARSFSQGTALGKGEAFAKGTTRLLESPLTAGMPDNGRKWVTWWLGGATGWVFALVVLGGVTRLTRSGLSMTDWKFSGEKPPMNQAEWEAEFAKYKESPEFKRVNLSMTVEEFKFIYWMEWAHRWWGRSLGMYFLIPFAGFVAKGWINKALMRRLLAIFAAGGAQGLIGWWMVKSGLEEPPKEWDVPRVSPYRLATHLTSAFGIFTALLWTTLTVGSPSPLMLQVDLSSANAMRRLRTRALPLTGLIAVTAVSGAFVAGMDAGRAYNDFPWMNGRLLPRQKEYFSIAPRWRNFFESTAAVQFDHRVLALSTLAAVVAFWAGARKMPLPRQASMWSTALLHMSGVQVTLGISALMMHVPVTLGSLHQAGALTLFSVMLALLHTLRASPTLRWGQAVLPMALLLLPASAAGTAGWGALTAQG